MTNIRLIVEYDGSRFKGWQRQEHAPSVQQVIEEAIEKITGEQIRLTVAGRTDAGVHAIAQVANFHIDSPMPAIKYAPGLNHHLGSDVSIHRSDEMPNSFSARTDSVHKRYRYRVYLARNPAAMESRAWHIKPNISTTEDACIVELPEQLEKIAAAMIARMLPASQHLLGEHDFESFRSVHCDATHAHREIFSIDISAKSRPPCGHVIDIEFFGNAFCRHMCRILAGTLVEVGQARREASSIPDILNARKRTAAGITAPPYGLTLIEVGFPEL